MKTHSVSFQAKINITSNDKLLSEKEVKKLAKLGENIGTDADTIELNAQKAQDMLLVSRTADFKSLTPNVESFNMIFKKQAESSLYQIIEKELTEIKMLYQKLKSMKF